LSSKQTPYRYDAEPFRQVFEQEFTYVAGLVRNTQRYGSRTAVLDPEGGREWTYAEFWRDARKLAAGLAGHGIGEDDVVVFDLLNGAEFALLWVAALSLGAIPTPINYRLAAGEISHVLNDSMPRAFFYDYSLAAIAEQALARSQHQPQITVEVGEHGAGQFAELLATTTPAPPLAHRSIYAESTRLYTSGTTGMPKGTSLPGLVEVLSAHDVIMHFPLEPQDKTLNMTPWFHRGGLYSGGPNPVFYVGAQVVPMRAFSAAKALDWVQEYGLTFLIGAPTNLGMLADEQEANPRNLESLRGIVTMGAPLDRHACLRYQSVLTPRIFNGYGTTETFWNTFLRPADLPEHAGTAGRASTDDDVAVVKVFEDRPSTPDELVARDNTEIGEVIIRSVKAGYSYVNNPEEQALRFRDGWMYTGDLGTWDEDGYVTIAGRRDDMIISGGENVHPTQVEAVLGEHPGVAESAVVGLPDEHWGEIVVAYVVRRDPNLTAAELDKYCHEHRMLAPFKRPRAYRFVDEIPLTATGKKRHFAVREMVREDAATGALSRP